MKLSTVLSRVKKVTAPTQGQRPFVRRALTVDAIFSCLLSAAAWAVRLMLRDLCTFAHHPSSTGPKAQVGYDGIGTHKEKPGSTSLKQKGEGVQLNKERQ